MKLKVFISSTMQDLEEERQAVANAINQNLFWEAVYAESFLARSESPEEVCLNEVQNSHIYIGIFKDRYGYIPNGNNPNELSVTAMEYEKARESQLPTFIFIFNDDRNRELQLEDFLKKVMDFRTGHLIKKFSNTKELVNEVFRAINHEVTINYIEGLNERRDKQLKNLYSLPYFEEMKKHFQEQTCYYIPRKLLKKESYHKYDPYFSFLEPTFDLYELVIQENKRILILADGGYGKSIELKSTAIKILDTKKLTTIPIYIELNTYTDEDFEEYIKCKIPEDLYPQITKNKSNLVFILDEFDQVKDKGTAERKIKTFIGKFDESTFILATRTNTYSNEFSDFQFKSFVLSPFTPDNVREYAVKLLDNESGNFLEKLRNRSLYDIAKIPLFLKYLIEIYQEEKDIPQNHSNILSKITTISLQEDENRLRSKYDPRQRYPASKIYKDLSNISLLMECVQRNFISIAEFHQIIDDSTKRRVLSELSVLKKSFYTENDELQFQHTMIQENLAAIILSDKDFRKILDFIGITIERRLAFLKPLSFVSRYWEYKPLGIQTKNIINDFIPLIFRQRVERIKPSWLNTVAFICQVRKKSDLIGFLIKHQPEVCFKFEYRMKNEEDKSRVFKKVFEKYTLRKIWIDRNKIDYEEMANFGKSQQIYNYLIKYAQSKEHFIYRYNALQLLWFMKELTDSSFYDLLIRYAKDENENPNVRHISLYILGWHGKAETKLIEDLINLKDDREDLVAAGFYYLVQENNSVDSYVDILIQGYKRARTTELVDISWNVRRGIKKIRTPEGLKKLIQFFIDDPYELTHIHSDDFFDKIINNSIDAFNEDESIYEEMKQLTIVVGDHHILQLHQNIYLFFQKTNSVLRVFKDIYETDLDNSYFLLSSIADDQCVNFLVEEYNKGKLSDDQFRIFINSLSSEKLANYDELLKLDQRHIENTVQNPEVRFEEMQQKKLTRKLEVIFDKEEFLKDLREIFDLEGKSKLGHEDFQNIYFNKWNNERYNQFVAEVLYNFLDRINNQKWGFDTLSEKINQWNYEKFTVEHIFNLLHRTQEFELTERQREFIVNFCIKSLDKIDFRTVLEPTHNGFTAKDNLAVRLWYFLRKFDLSYPENILLDMLSFDWIEGNEFVGIDYITDHLSEEVVKPRIKENLKNGIAVDQILKNHILYCKKHKVLEAKTILCDLVKNHNIEIETRILILETLVELGVSDSFLETLLNVPEIKLYSRIVKLLLPKNNKRCLETIKKNLKSDNTKLAMLSAEFLIERQDINAIKFYARKIKETKQTFVYFGFGNESPFSKVTNIKALPVCLDLLNFAYQCKSEGQRELFSSMERLITDVLKNIALQSFSNFKKVLNRLEKFIKTNESQFEGINFLYVSYDNIEKAFWTSCSTQLSIDEAKRKVNALA